MPDSISDLRRAFYGTTEIELATLREAIAAGRTFSSLTATGEGIAKVAGTGGVVVDTEARAAIDVIITRLEFLGLIATV